MKTPDYKFYLFREGQEVAGTKSLEFSLMMLDAINFDTHFVVAINQNTEMLTYLRTKDDADAFIEARARGEVWHKSDVQNAQARPVFKDGMYFMDKTGGSKILDYLDEVLCVDYAMGQVHIWKNGDCRIFQNKEDAKVWLADMGFEAEELAESPANKMLAAEAPVDKIEKAVDAPHYKGYIEEMQWIDALSKIPSLRKPERFIAALELQIRKYMDRNGQKDDTIQEWKKARFYMVYLVAYMENGYVCIPAADIHERMKGL